MNPILYNLDNVYNKNILLLGRRASGKTNLLKKIIDLQFDKIHLINIFGANNTDEELNLPTNSIDKFGEIYNEIINSEGKKLLIIENFHNIQTTIEERFNDIFNDLLTNKLYNLTIILVSNNLQIRLECQQTIDALFLSSVHFNIHNYINNMFNQNINENIFENLITKFIDNRKYLVFTKKLIYYF